MVKNINANPSGILHYTKKQADSNQKSTNQTAATNAKGGYKSDTLELSGDDLLYKQESILNRIVSGEYSPSQLDKLRGELREVLTQLAGPSVTEEDVVRRAQLLEESRLANDKPSGPVSISHTINLGTEENPIWATIRPNQIFIAKGNDPNSKTHILLDLSKGMDGIGEDTLQMLKYTQMLVQGMNSGAGNGNPNATGSPIQVLNALLFNITMAFGETSGQSGINNAVLESAFRNMALSLFDDAISAIHAGTDNDYDLAQARADVRILGETYLNVFFQHHAAKGTETAFHEAWNYTYFEVGMGVLGGTQAEDGAYAEGAKMHEALSTSDSRRYEFEHLLNLLREGREQSRIQAEALAEEARRWQQLLEIFRRMARGDNVPQSDQDFLAEHSPGLFMVALATMQENENPEDHEPLATDRDDEGQSVNPVVAQAFAAYGLPISGGEI
jgi:hypothetical protein